MTVSVTSAVVVAASAVVIEVRHRVATTRATDGFGAACSFGDEEVYTILECWKIA